MDWLSQTEALIKDLKADPEVQLSKAVVEAATEEVDLASVDDFEEEFGWRLDSAMRGFFGSVASLHIEWSHRGLDAIAGYPTVCGRMEIGPYDQIGFSGYDAKDLPSVGFRNEAEREHLLALHHVSVQTATGSHWLAVRPRPDGSLAMWWRTSGTDVPLLGGFDVVVGKMFECRGLVGWPLLCAGLEDVDRESRSRMLADPSGEAAWLRRRLQAAGNLLNAQAIGKELDQVIEARG